MHPTTSNAMVSRAVRLRARTSGLPSASAFEVVSGPVVAGPGDVVVRNRFFRISASVRMMISEGAESIEGVPFPPLQPGDTLSEAAVGVVVEAPAESGLGAGDLVLHHAGFREIAVVPVRDCRRLDDALDPAFYLSHGGTAYAALSRAARVRAGDVVFVTSAAGAVGSMAAMIARKLGAARVIGSTSSATKAARLCADLGYDAVVVRAAGPLVPQLRAAAPMGVDVVLDNVGGSDLEAAVRCARRGARIIVLGALSGQLAPGGTGREAPVVLDSFPILLQRLTLRGYSADDDPECRAEFERLFAAGSRAEEMAFPHVRVRGIEAAPAAVEDAIRGRYVGVVIVEI